MIDLNLPEPIAAYFDADRRDGEAVARCFTADAVVKDEGRTYRGQTAIAGWKSDASAKYAYTSAPFDLTREADRHVVQARVTGSFPGSPVMLKLSFRLERGKIASLEVMP